MKHIVLMTLNYSHDIASALLAVSGIAMWLLSKHYPSGSDNKRTEHYFIAAYRGITRIAKDSLYYIVIAGIPRIIFYMQYEWSDLAGDLQIVAVVIKHIVIFLLIGSGIYFWAKLGRQVKQMQGAQALPALQTEL